MRQVSFQLVGSVAPITGAPATGHTPNESSRQTGTIDLIRLQRVQVRSAITSHCGVSVLKTLSETFSGTRRSARTFALAAGTFENLASPSKSYLMEER